MSEDIIKIGNLSLEPNHGHNWVEEVLPDGRLAVDENMLLHNGEYYGEPGSQSIALTVDDADALISALNTVVTTIRRRQAEVLERVLRERARELAAEVREEYTHKNDPLGMVEAAVLRGIREGLERADG